MGVGLVAVGDNELVFIFSDGSIDNQAGIFHLAGIKRLGEHGILPLGEDAVAAVGAAPHDEVGEGGVLAVGGFAHHNASAGVGVALQTGRHGL